MSEKRQEIKVGIFVLIGLILIAALMLFFSKSQSLFQSTYTVYMTASNVGGLKRQAKVLLSGVEVGTVEDISLSPNGELATVKLKLLEKYKIHKDAVFKIAALGFLGDQYIAVRPTKNEGDILHDGEVISGKGPLEFEQLASDLQEMVPTAKRALTRLDEMATQLNQSIKRVDRMVLNEETLGNLSLAVSNILLMSDSAVTTVNNINALFETNALPLNDTMTNLSKFSGQLNLLADELNQTVITNRESLTRAMENLERASDTLNALLGDVNAGKGVAGSLIHDEQLRVELSTLVTNLNSAARNFSAFGSNINSRGLWSVLWKPKEPKKKDEARR